MMTTIPNLDELIRMALLEDLGDGDHSTLACIPPTAINSAKMVAKQDGILCGMEVGERVFHFVNDSYYHNAVPMKVTCLKRDGDSVSKGDVLMVVEGASGAILTAERTALNYMQRLSGIATETYPHTPVSFRCSALGQYHVRAGTRSCASEFSIDEVTYDVARPVHRQDKMIEFACNEDRVA